MIFVSTRQAVAESASTVAGLSSTPEFDSNARMTNHRSLGLVIAGVLVACVASYCGGGGGKSCVASADVSGLWSGTANDEVARGAISVDVTFTQNGCAIGGTWQTDFPAPGTGQSQDIRGFTDGAAIRFEIKAPTVSCRTRITATVDSPTQITGTYATRNCSQSDAGDFVITFRGALPTPAATATFPSFTPLPAATPTPTPG
jgi:hypothetical protein